jgi:serine/threonine protein kinase
VDLQPQCPSKEGTRIGPYEVTSPLGEGGMGVVFRAHGTKLQRDVALKLLPDQFADDADLVHYGTESRLGKTPTLEFYVDFETVSDLNDDFKNMPERVIDERSPRVG